jgi:hypothetical protein
MVCTHLGSRGFLTDAAAQPAALPTEISPRLTLRELLHVQDVFTEVLRRRYRFLRVPIPLAGAHALTNYPHDIDLR